jgi:uncharacterized membrane protein
MRFGELAVRAGAASFVQSSALGVALLVARMMWTHEAAYGFLLWNLFLAWVPWGCAVVVRALHERRAHPALLLPAFVVWLGFLPNAPYIVTDFIHLRFRDGAPLWFDAVMLASYAWAGVGLGVASLRICAQVVRARGGAWLSVLFVALSGLATGYGIYLGRFIRLNTWDVVSQPLAVLDTALTPVVHPFTHPHAWVVTFTFALFFLAAYGTNRGSAIGPRQTNE